MLIAFFFINFKKRFARFAAVFLTLIVIAALGLMSFQQSRIWNNSVSFFRHMIRTLGNDPYRYDIQWRLAYFIATHPEIKDRDVNEAIRLSRQVCEVTNYQVPITMDALAVAYAAAGRFSEAVDLARKASDIAQAGNQLDIKQTIDFHLTFFEQGRPFIEQPLKIGDPNYLSNL